MRRHKNVPAFGQYSTRLISELESDLRWGTSRTYSKTRSSFLKFLETDVPLDRIDGHLIISYNNYLRSRGVVRNTISFYNRVLRAMYNRAVVEYGIPDLRPFSGVYTGVDRTKSKAVPMESISRLARADLGDNASISLARDIFVFSYCLRGMPFVDVAYLRKSQISGGCLTYSRRKTGATLRIKLEPEAMAIIRRYSEVTADSPYVFPLLNGASDCETSEHTYRRYQSTLSTYDRNLKLLSSILGIGEKLSSHSARHSWATTGFSATKDAGMSSVSVDLSSQTVSNSPKDIPFVAYGTIAYTSGTPSLTDRIVDFSFATSIMRLNCSGLEADAAIIGAELIGFSNQCVLNITRTGASIGQGESGDIALSPAADFKANNKGARSMYASIAKNETAAEQTLEVNQAKTYEYDFGSQSRSAGQSINAICSTTEQQPKPYVVIAGLKWARQNLAISESGNKSWKGGNSSAVKVPGTDWNVINGDYFQWATYKGYCQVEGQTVEDKGLLIYESFTSTLCGDDADAFNFKSPEAGKNYCFSFSSSGDNIAISPYFIETSVSTWPEYGKYTSYMVNLEKSDDVANIILEDPWRMPTAAEFQAMYDATYWAWDATDRGYYVFKPGEGTSGRAGDQFGTIAYTDDKTKALLFFPAAGAGGFNGLNAVGICGGYWSSNTYYDPLHAFYLHFEPQYGGMWVTPQLNSYRSTGFIVRPVSD